MARRKNVKRIDPRYFLHETVNRGEEELEGAGPAGMGIHQNQSPVPGRPDPRFGRMTVTFDSEVDKALYIVYNAMKKSKREPDFLQWLSSLGYTQDEMMRNGETIKGELKRQVSEHPDFPGWSGWSSMTGELNIPMTAEEPIEVV